MINKELPGTWLLEALGRAGVDISMLLETIPDIIERTLQGPEHLHPDEVNQLLILSAQSSGEVDFGLKLLELVDISMYGTYGYLLSSARTIREHLELASRYYSILYLGNTIKFEVSDDNFTIEYTINSPTEYCSRHFTEWTLGFFCDFFQARLGTIATPIKAQFQHSKPLEPAHLATLFGPNIIFEQASNKLIFDKELLDKPLSDTEPQLLKIILEQAESALQRVITEDSFEAKVKLLILENLEGRSATAKQTAQQLNMSLATFKRKLSSGKLNFRDLRDDIRNKRAKELLKCSGISINQIAFNSGFAEHSAFSRFFTRLNQVTPIKYRSHHQTR